MGDILHVNQRSFDSLCTAVTRSFASNDYLAIVLHTTNPLGRGPGEFFISSSTETLSSFGWEIDIKIGHNPEIGIRMELPGSWRLLGVVLWLRWIDTGQIAPHNRQRRRELGICTKQDYPLGPRSGVAMAAITEPATRTRRIPAKEANSHFGRK